MLSGRQPGLILSFFCFCVFISFLAAGQAWAINTYGLSPSNGSGSGSATRGMTISHGSNNGNPARNITMKADLVLIPGSMTVGRKNLAIGEKVEIRAMVQNTDAVERRKVRVRFSCGSQQKDIFVNLRSRQRQLVRFSFALAGPAGVKMIRVEVNPVHRELIERNYRNNTGISRIVVREKKNLQLQEVKPSFKLETPAAEHAVVPGQGDSPAPAVQVSPRQMKAGHNYVLKIQGKNFPPEMSVAFDPGIKSTGDLQVISQAEVRIGVRVSGSASPGRYQVTLRGVAPAQNTALMAMSPPVFRSYVEVVPAALNVPRKIPSLKPQPLAVKPVLSSLRPSRWLPGRGYQVTILGEHLDGVDAVSFGPGIKVSNLKHRGKTALFFSLQVEKKTSTGVRFAMVEQSGREEKTAVRAWVVRPPVKLTQVPPLVWKPVTDFTLRQGAIFLQEPEWSFSGDMANNKHPVPVLNDETVLTWKEEVPGLADQFEIRFLTPAGTLVYSKTIDLGNPAVYITAFKPGSQFIAELFHQFSSIDRAGSKFRRQRPNVANTGTKASDHTFNDHGLPRSRIRTGVLPAGKAVHTSEGQKFTLQPPVFSAAYTPGAAASVHRMTPVETYIRDHKNEVNLLWQVVGYKKVNHQPKNARPSGKKLRNRKLGRKKKEVKVLSVELVEIELSEQWPLHLPDTWPTGVTCDAENQFEFSKVEWSHPGGRDSGDPNHYPGDTLEIGGNFSINNSPWAISAKTTYKGGGSMADDFYQFNNVIVDWGDGSWSRLQATAVESSLPGWSNADVMNFDQFHQYSYPGSFQIKVYVVPQDQMDQVDTIVAAHASRPVQKTADAGEEKLIRLASSGQIVSDAGSPGYSLGGSSKTNSAAASMEMPGSRIFMLYCNPMDVTIIQDTAATGPLHLDDIEIVAFSSDEVAAGPGGAGKYGLKKSGPALKKGGKKHIRGVKSAVGNLRKTNDIHSLTATVERSQIVSLGEDTVVSICAGGLWAGGRLKYYGQGYARIQWLVDGVVVNSREVKIGPSELRQDLTSSDSSAWGEPLRSDFLLESPRLPIKDTGLHRLRLSAVVIPDPTWSMVNSVALQSSVKKLGRKNSKKRSGKKSSSTGFRPLLPPVSAKGGLQPAIIPIASSNGTIGKTWSNSSDSMLMSLRKATAKNILEPGKNNIFLPPYSVISPEKRYLVQENTSDMPCRFDFPTQEGVFEVAGLKNLQAQNQTYSGNGLLIYKLPDGGPNSTSEHYVPVSFHQWQVPDGLSVQQGVLEVNANEKIDTLPGMTATLTALKGAAGSHLKAVMDVAIKDATIRLAGSEVPPVWQGVSSPLTADGDWYAAGLHMGRTRIGWSMTNIESDDIRLDLSHSEGESPACGYGGPAWVGIHLGDATLHPYLFDLADIPIQVSGWGIADAGLCGHAETGSFSHAFGNGAIGWSKLTINAFKSGISAQYAGFYVDMAWPKIHLEGSNTHFSYSPGSDVDVQLGFDQLPVSTEHYDVMDMKIISKSFSHTESGWGLQADAELTFKDEQGGLFADAVAVNNLLFSIYGYVEYTGSSIPLDIKGQVGGADELISAMDIKVGDENSRSKITFDFTTEFSLEGLGRSEAPVHIIYGINKDFGHDAFSTGPEHPAEIVLQSHYPETNPVSSNEFRIKYEHGSGSAGGGGGQRYAANSGYSNIMNDAGSGYLQLASGASVSGGGCGNDTFGGHVDTHMFGDNTPAIEGTFRFGEDGGNRYWLAFLKGDNLHIPVFAAVYLEMVQGGLAYNFDHDAFNQAGGFNACPSPGKGVLFSTGMGLSIGESDVIQADGVLTIQPSDSYYELLCHALLFGQADLSGRLRYWQSAFDGEIWGDLSLLGDQIYIKAPEHSCGIHVDSGEWKFFMGTKALPVSGHVTSAVHGDAYLVLGSEEGFLVGAKYSQYYDKTSHGWGVAGTVTLGGEVSLALNPLRFDGGLSGHIGGKFINPVKDIGLGVGTHSWIGCCSPVKFGFGFDVSCCCVSGGADIYILPSPDIGAHAKCTCCDPRDWF